MNPFLNMYGAEVELSPLLVKPLISLFYQPRIIDGDDCGAVCGMNEWQGKLKYLQKTSPSATLSNTDPT
jgi:hypothetical protein